MAYEAIVSALQCGKAGCACQRWRGNGNLHCPVRSQHTHGDAEPSLTTKIVPNAKYGEGLILNCKKGCTQDAVLQELRGMALWPPPQEERAALTPNRERPRKMVAEWPYKNSDGTVIAWKTRFEYQDREGGKTFLWRREGSTSYGGLGGIAMEAMPFYNLDGVLEDKDAPVYVVEGEKAADALIEHGILAISFGGGANQQRFEPDTGVKWLDYLRPRDVILWPDNDDAGYALMTRLATALPKARFQRLPDWLGEKADAYDFFEDERGTIELVEELVQTREPRVRWEDDGEVLVIEVDVAKGTVRASFTDWTIKRNEVEVDVVVSVGGQQGDEFDASARLNLRSLSNTESYRRLLDGFFGKDWEWTKLTTRIFRLAERTYNSAAQSVDLAEVTPDYTAPYRLDKLFPEGQPAILFGAGGAGKTSIIMDIICGILYDAAWMGRYAIPPAAVLYVDYESGQKSVVRRYWRALEGRGRTPLSGVFNYFAARGRPLANMVPALRAELKRTGAEILIVDSVAPAIGGRPEDSDAVLAMFRAIEQLKVTSILIAHTNRLNNQDTKFMPFGSVFFHNEARATHYLEAVGRRHSADDMRYLDLVLYPRKMSDDELPKSIPLTIEFTGATGAVCVVDGAATSAGIAAGEPADQEEAVVDALRAADLRLLRPTIVWVVDYIKDTWPHVKKVSASRAGNILRDLVRRGTVGQGTSAATGKAKVYWLLENREVEGTQAEWVDAPPDDDAPPIEDEGSQ